VNESFVEEERRENILPPCLSVLPYHGPLLILLPTIILFLLFPHIYTSPLYLACKDLNDPCWFNGVHVYRKWRVIWKAHAEFEGNYKGILCYNV